MVTWRTGISCQLLGASAATTHQLLSSAFWNDSDFDWFVWQCSRNIWDSFSHRQPWINLSQRDSHRERPGFHERWLTDKPFWSRTWNWQGTKQACWGWNSSCLSKRKNMRNEICISQLFDIFWPAKYGDYGVGAWVNIHWFSRIVGEEDHRPWFVTHHLSRKLGLYHDEVIVIQSVIFPSRPVEFTYSYQIDFTVTMMR